MVSVRAHPTSKCLSSWVTSFQTSLASPSLKYLTFCLTWRPTQRLPQSPLSPTTHENNTQNSGKCLPLLIDHEGHSTRTDKWKRYIEKEGAGVGTMLLHFVRGYQPQIAWCVPQTRSSKMPIFSTFYGNCIDVYGWVNFCYSLNVSCLP